MMRIVLILMFFMVLAPGSIAEEQLLERAKSIFKPIPDTPLTIKNNPLTPVKVELGKMLFFDPRLSSSGLISCNTCHNIGTGGVDLVETSIGHGWQKGPRNAPTVYNAVYNIAQFWDGRAKDLAEQAKGPVQASVEMANSPERTVATLKSMPEYVELFSKAFPGEKSPLTFDNMAKAIEVFESTLITPDSKFDKFLKGDSAALSDEEKMGLKLFVDTGCTGCHNGVNIGGGGYFKFGSVKNPGPDVRPPGDLGRYNVTKNEYDKYSFRVPTLRNIGLTPPYFHSGRVWDLKEAVLIMGTTQLGLELSDKEADTITAFLQTLTGEMPKIEYPMLPPRTKDTPLPVYEVKTPDEQGH